MKITIISVLVLTFLLIVAFVYRAHSNAVDSSTIEKGMASTKANKMQILSAIRKPIKSTLIIRELEKRSEQNAED